MTALPVEVEAAAAAIRRQELDRTYARLGGRDVLDPAQCEALEDLADAIVAGVLGPPAVAVGQGVDPAMAARLLPSDAEA